MNRSAIAGILCLLTLFYAACASHDRKPGISMQKDIVIDVRDAAWDFSGLAKVYLYTETVNSQDEKDAVNEFMTLLSPRGVECILDTGESITYDNPNLQVKAHRKLMSLLTSIYLLKPGIKGNEEIIAVISADTPFKAAAEAIKYIDGVRPAPK